MSTNYSMQQPHHSFVSPLRGTASAAVPHNKREMSSSPFLGKKKGDFGQARDFKEDEMNRMFSYNLNNQAKGMDEAERQYLQIIELERAQHRKRDQANKEVISELSKKLKSNERKLQEESKLCQEYKKRHDLLKKRTEKQTKDKNDSVNQLKSLFVLFTQQRKALEVSIGKTKRLEDDNQRLEQRNKNLEDHHRQFSRRIEQLEQDRELLLTKHKRDKEHLEIELGDKRQLIKRYENDFKEINNQKILIKRQLDEYESKIKMLIKELEDESKRHIKETNEVHEYYRGFKSSAQELDQRIKHYKLDCDKALKSERDSKKEVVRLTLENDELQERIRFIESKYQSVVHRLGASPEVLDAIENELMMEADQEAQVIHPKKQGRSHRKEKTSEKSHPFHKVVDVKQAKKQEFGMEDSDDSRRRGGRNESRLEKRRSNDVVDSYQYYGNQVGEESDSEEDQHHAYSHNKNKVTDGVISGEQIIENSQKKNQQVKGSNKKTNIEVLDEHRPIQEYFNEVDDQEGEGEGESESGDLLNKLIENLNGNPALQNEYIKQQFKLDQIEKEEDLHDYKNLLNSMAALFYTNHRMNDVTMLFYVWKEAAEAIQNQRQMSANKQQTQNSNLKKGSVKKGKAVPDIEIDTELANEDVFVNYENQQDEGSEPSEIGQDDELKDNKVIDIEGVDLDLDSQNDDHVKDRQLQKFFEDLKQVGPYSKQILNYTYPPLLYQRGDDDEGEEEEEEDRDNSQLPDFGPELDEEEDQDIQELIRGEAGHSDRQSKQKQGVKDKEAQQYYEQVDENGNVYLVEANQDEDGDYGEEDIDDEEFLQMMEQEAAEGRQGQLGREQQDSTIINSSQNTSLEDNFLVE